MKTFCIKRTNPIEDFKSFFSLHGKISKNKYWEIESYRYNWYWIDLEFEWKWYGYDHAGIELGIGILGYYILLKLYDHRHWNTELNDWTTYDE